MIHTFLITHTPATQSSPLRIADEDAPKEIIVETEETPKFTCEGLAPGQPVPYILGMKYFIDSLDIKKLQCPYNE